MDCTPVNCRRRGSCAASRALRPWGFRTSMDSVTLYVTRVASLSRSIHDCQTQWTPSVKQVSLTLPLPRLEPQNDDTLKTSTEHRASQASNSTSFHRDWNKEPSITELSLSVRHLENSHCPADLLSQCMWNESHTPQKAMCVFYSEMGLYCIVCLSERFSLHAR